MGTVNSPRLGIPAPDGNERVMDGDNAMVAIANHLDSLATAGIPLRIAAGTATVPAGAGATNTAAVTFPVGRFTAAPMVSAISIQNTLTGGVIGAGGVTTSGFTAITGTLSGSGTIGSIALQWIAIQL